MERSSPRMTGGSREAPVNVSPAVAANAEGEEIEVLESTDVLPWLQRMFNGRLCLTRYVACSNHHLLEEALSYMHASSPGFCLCELK
ncbi:hypothetical protein OJAV_G00008400 [Oryzias javanicus]|uniref:Uncharacterized protein n=1 Tax=Oryzias javanicus TaxID=123683 RepID=A0A3S2Q1T5_ORYJA|nr:hypothetical protein OJAV_G00008400 [Oryzias javanicus]